MPHITEVFQSGNLQAVRLPKDLRFTVDDSFRIAYCTTARYPLSNRRTNGYHSWT